MRIGFGLALVIVVVGCTPKREDAQGTVDAYDGNQNCTGLECQIVDCEKMGMPPTTLSGTVYAPNGTLALYGATAYIPQVDPGPFHEGVECTQCMDQLPGGAITHSMSDIAGKFQLSNVPSGTDIPLFVTIGKWRRKTTIPVVTPCQDNPLPATITSLPKNQSEGDIPKIAITTGRADAIECLLRKLGVHAIWIDGEEGVPTHAPAVWPEVATCDMDGYDSGTGVIDEVNNPKGNAFAQWMTAVGGSTTPGTVTINDSRQSCSAIDNNKAERWVYMKIGGVDYPQNFQFTTPLEAAKEDRCGKVVFSDMHVASGSTSSSGTPFPMGCSTAEMSAQEKALSFMLFDIATCVGPIL